MAYTRQRIKAQVVQAFQVQSQQSCFRLSSPAPLISFNPRKSSVEQKPDLTVRRTKISRLGMTEENAIDVTDD